MGMQLNIKNVDTVRLAHKVAKAGGTSVTHAVHSALERADADYEAAIQAKIQSMNALVSDFQRHMPEEWRGKTSKELMDAIYDDEQPDGFAK
jgi:antitoxin VapB